MPLNYLKTALLLAAMTAILVALGGTVGGEAGLVLALAISLVMNIVSLWGSDSIVLRMHGAQEVDAQSAPDYYAMVAELAQRAGLPMPRACIMHNPQPNAFATGRSPSKSAVCVSTGLLEMLTKEEVAGVIAHELAHIKNRDTLTMTVAATMAGAISTFTNMLQFRMILGSGRNRGNWITNLLAMLFAPLAAMLVQMAISRSREYAADRLGAEICGNPLWLASALAKIHNFARQIENPSAEAVPASAHMFIVNPLSGRGIDNFFSTHPAIENRIAELEQIAAEQGMAGEVTLDDGGEGVRGAGGGRAPGSFLPPGVGRRPASTSVPTTGRRGFWR